MNFLFLILSAGILRFAVLTDTHVSTADSPAAKALEACIDDINSLNADKDPDNDIAFVIHAGDETDFGTDEEEALVHSMLQRLTVPIHAVPGNHDATWSESGSNSFKNIYGAETFCFEEGGWRFVGCPCGPNVRMSPALISRESLVWIYSLPYHDRTVFINHYPPSSEISNCREFRSAAESIGTKLFIGGHHHINYVDGYDGTPGILCRSSLVNKKSRRAVEGGQGCGYTVITLTDCSDSESGKSSDAAYLKVRGKWSATAVERYCPEYNGFIQTEPWYSDSFAAAPKRLWSRVGDADIAAGFAVDWDFAWYGTTAGDVICRKLSDGNIRWQRKLGGKIYSTPALSEIRTGRRPVKILVIGCADGRIYALNAANGKNFWSIRAQKAVLASPVIKGNVVYIGASDGVFRAIDLQSGKTLWQNDSIRGHVITKAYIDDKQVVFGSWGRTLYSLDPATGQMQWKWKHPHGSRMYSPAACWCVKSYGKIFAAVPDRKVWIFDAENGEVLGTIDGAREALGISQDGRYVFSKTMNSKLVCIDTESGLEKWRVNTPVGYDISPSEIKVDGDCVIVPTDKGQVFAFSAKDGSRLWHYSFSCALVNPVSVLPDGKILLSSMDGRICLINP